MFGPDRVFVIDSKSLSSGSGQIVCECGERIKKGLGAKQISEEVSAITDRVSASFLGIRGENGAGKSTTISILCTILNKTGGSVRIYDHELGKEDDKIRDLIGKAFRNHGPLFRFNGMVFLGRR